MKRARFDACAELKTALGSQCLQGLTRLALEERLKLVREKLRRHRMCLDPSEACLGCGLPLQDGGHHQVLMVCPNQACHYVLRCDWKTCKTAEHRCHICQSFACDDGEENCVLQCNMCNLPVCEECITPCLACDCSCQRCAPGPYDNTDDALCPPHHHQNPEWSERYIRECGHVRTGTSYCHGRASPDALTCGAVICSHYSHRDEKWFGYERCPEHFESRK